MKPRLAATLLEPVSRASSTMRRVEMTHYAQQMWFQVVDCSNLCKWNSTFIWIGPYCFEEYPHVFSPFLLLPPPAPLPVTPQKHWNDQKRTFLISCLHTTNLSTSPFHPWCQDERHVLPSPHDEPLHIFRNLSPFLLLFPERLCSMAKLPSMLCLKPLLFYWPCPISI